MRITECKVNHLVNPAGYDLGKKLRFSWNVEETEEKDLSFRVVVKEGENVIHDSGYGDLDFTGYEVKDITLKPETVYSWTVSAKGSEEVIGEEQFFETGKMDETWSAEWITCAESDRLPIFTKELKIEKEVSKARLHITGLGLYEASIDGKKIGDELLTPYCNNYNAWVQALTYDVTDALGTGDHNLSVLMGPGWYSGRFGFSSKPGDEGFYGKGEHLLSELHLFYADGSEEVIGTDDSWKVLRSKITDSSIYDGETFDANLSDTEPEDVITEEIDVPAVDRYSQPVRVIEERKGTILTTPKGETVIDLGQNVSCIFAMKVKAPKGDTVHIQFGEVMQDECFYRDNLRTALAEYNYISDGNEAVIRPVFTFYGGRFVKVSLVHDGVESAMDPDAFDFTAMPITTKLESVGSIETGHDLVNQLVSNIRWGCMDNFVDVPTDCPQRDERMGWTADTQVFTASASSLFDTYAFYRKYLHDMDTEQKERKGGVPYTVPSFGVPEGSSVWGDAACMIPMVLYDFYGDVTILEEQFESMKSWVDYITAVDGENYGWRDAFHFGDWLAIDLPGAEVSATKGATDPAFIADVYYMNSAELTARAADILGREEEKEKYTDLADKIRERISQEFFTPLGRCAVDTQTGLLLTLKHHLGPVERTTARLREKFKGNDDKLNCGFVGAPIMNRVLADYGMDSLAAKLLLNEEFPGWLHEIHLGATTVWERWNSLDEEGHVSSTGMNSFNHYAYGAVLEWMFHDLAGISSLEPGFKAVRIQPRLVKKLGHLDASYRSICGLFEVHWKMEGKNVTVSFTVPYGVKAEVVLPEAPESAYEQLPGKTVGAGNYTVTYERKTDHKQVDTSTPVKELLADERAEEIVLSIMPEVKKMLGTSYENDSLRTIARKMDKADMVQLLDRIDAMLKEE